MVLARNVRCKVGELDLVCLDGAVLAIVEVRQRVRAEFGGAQIDDAHRNIERGRTDVADIGASGAERGKQYNGRESHSRQRLTECNGSSPDP